jgi:thiamine biosynthesis lipoprotein
MVRDLGVVLAFVLLWGISALADGGKAVRYEFEQMHMGTLFRIVFYSVEGADPQEAARKAFLRIEQLEGVLSSYLEESELRKVQLRAFESPQVLSPDLFSVLESSLQISRITRGVFDVTVRPFVLMWRRARVERVLPDQVFIDRESQRVGFHHVLLNSRTQSLRFAIPGIEIDLGAIGKGYAADEALAVLKKHKISRALVYAGGDIRLGEPPPGEAGWSVALGERSGGQEVELRNCAIASSGDAFQFVEIEGVRYSHIIDPRTGFGVPGMRKTTVIAPRATLADALATALTILGPEEGFEIIRGLDGVSARFVHFSNGVEKVVRSEGFPQ